MSVRADQAIGLGVSGSPARSGQGRGRELQVVAPPGPQSLPVAPDEETQPRDDRRFWSVAALFGLLSLVFLVFLVTLRGRRTTYVVDNAAQLVSGLVAMTMCAVAARRRKQRYRGWALLAASLLIAVCGNAIWCYYNIILSGEVVRSSVVGDVCGAVVLPLAIGGVLTFPGALGNLTSNLRGVLDSVLIATGMFFMSWVLVLSPVYQHASGGVVVEVFNLGYPASGLVVASLVVILATRASGHHRLSLSLVSAGLVSCAVADSSYSYLMALNRYGIGSATDFGWVLGYLLVALGALRAWDHPVPGGKAPSAPTLRTLVGPNLPLLGVIAVATWQVYVHHSLDLVSRSPSWR